MAAPHYLRLVSETTKSPRKVVFSIADYLQLARVTRRSVRIEVEDRVLDVVDGRLHRVEDAEGKGYEALMRILTGGGLLPGEEPQCFEVDRSKPANLSADIEGALLDAARVLDERALTADDLQSYAAVEGQTVPEETRPPPGLQEVEIAVDAMMRKDYVVAQAALERAIEQGNTEAMVLSNLERIQKILRSS